MLKVLPLTAWPGELIRVIRVEAVRA
ncbi:MAG: hypothetical protein MGAcid_10070 [uncultured Acidilobus sp. MG]|nr:MAG: hypothetical protein MGAcid_10070 [uncultured Acidilobus sp. MG]